MYSVSRIDNWVSQLKAMGKKVYVGGTSQGSITTFAYAKRSPFSGMADGIICFNTFVTAETQAAPFANATSKDWDIFTWSGMLDNKFNYTVQAS